MAGTKKRRAFTLLLSRAFQYHGLHPHAFEGFLHLLFGIGHVFPCHGIVKEVGIPVLPGKEQTVQGIDPGEQLPGALQIILVCRGGLRHVNGGPHHDRRPLGHVLLTKLGQALPVQFLHGKAVHAAILEELLRIGAPQKHLPRAWTHHRPRGVLMRGLPLGQVAVDKLLHGHIHPGVLQGHHRCDAFTAGGVFLPLVDKGGVQRLCEHHPVLYLAQGAVNHRGLPQQHQQRAPGKQAKQQQPAHPHRMPAPSAHSHVFHIPSPFPSVIYLLDEGPQGKVSFFRKYRIIFTQTHPREGSPPGAGAIQTIALGTQKKGTPKGIPFSLCLFFVSQVTGTAWDPHGCRSGTPRNGGEAR